TRPHSRWASNEDLIRSHGRGRWSALHLARGMRQSSDGDESRRALRRAAHRSGAGAVRGERGHRRVSICLRVLRPLVRRVGRRDVHRSHQRVGPSDLAAQLRRSQRPDDRRVRQLVACADDGLVRLQAILGAGYGKSLNVARVFAYGGYSYVLLGEGYCDAPVALSAGLPPAELFRRAIVRFDSAIAVATAASAGAPAATVTAAQDIINMARVGAARAALKMNDFAKSKGYAILVPDTYEK